MSEIVPNSGPNVSFDISFLVFQENAEVAVREMLKEIADKNMVLNFSVSCTPVPRPERHSTWLTASVRRISKYVSKYNLWMLRNCLI